MPKEDKFDIVGYFGDIEKKESEGIRVFYFCNKIIKINAFYDGNYCIKGEELYLSEFFNKLGITKKDCDDAFNSCETKTKHAPVPNEESLMKPISGSISICDIDDIIRNNLGQEKIICPNCKNWYEFDCDGERFDRNNFCPLCGIQLNWSDYNSLNDIKNNEKEKR